MNFLGKLIEVWYYHSFYWQDSTNLFLFPALAQTPFFDVLSWFFFPLGGLKSEIYDPFAQMLSIDLQNQTSGHIFRMGFWNNTQVIFLAYGEIQNFGMRQKIYFKKLMETSIFTSISLLQKFVFGQTSSFKSEDRA